MEMLLYNRSVWCPPDLQSTPILMICHTNHALDQFLEMIVRRLKISEGLRTTTFTRENFSCVCATLGVVRVGSRCQNPIIERFSLQNKYQSARETRSLPRGLCRAKREAIGDKVAAEMEFNLYQDMMKASQTEIVPFSALNDCDAVDCRHVRSLSISYNDAPLELALLKWLGISHSKKKTSKYDMKSGEQQISIPSKRKRNSTRDNMGDEVFDEEEERRRNELDVEEYEYSSLLNSSQPETITRHMMDAHPTFVHETRSEYERQNKRLIRYIIERPTTLNDDTVHWLGYDVWQLADEQRYDLYRYWLTKYQQYVRNCISHSSENCQQVASKLERQREEEEFYLLKDSMIVAMTTTCAAKYHRILEELRKNSITQNGNSRPVLLFRKQNCYR